MNKVIMLASLCIASVSCGGSSRTGVPRDSFERMRMMSRDMTPRSPSAGMTYMRGSGGMRAMRELMAWMGGAELSGDPAEPRPLEDAKLRNLGARVFGERCSVCHGEQGDGRGREAVRLSVPPRDFTSGTYKLRSTTTGSLPTDEDLFRTISRGMHGTSMLPWVALSERERWALVAHLKTRSPRFADAGIAEPIVVPSQPPETTELAARGRAVYERSGCTLCHGDQGHGDGLSTSTLFGARGESLRPRDFAEGRFLRGTRMKDIYLTLRTGLDGSPMPSFESALTPEETWALAAYVRSLMPAHRNTGAMMRPMMIGADQEERLGMMIDMPGMPMGVPGMR